MIVIMPMVRDTELMKFRGFRLRSRPDQLKFFSRSFELRYARVTSLEIPSWRYLLGDISKETSRVNQNEVSRTNQNEAGPLRDGEEVPALHA
jgi:hypothetical protein